MQILVSLSALHLHLLQTAFVSQRAVLFDQHKAEPTVSTQSQDALCKLVAVSDYADEAEDDEHVALISLRPRPHGSTCFSVHI